jgi:hypothetical protein
MLKSVEHLVIFAQDSTSLARWYCDTLGFETVVALEDKGQYFLRAGEAGITTEAANAPGIRHIAIVVVICLTRVADVGAIVLCGQGPFSVETHRLG